MAAVWKEDSDTAFVWKVSPASMTVGRAPVEIGDLSGADALILSGLEEGDLIAVSGVQNLRDGMKVRRFEK